MNFNSLSHKLKIVKKFITKFNELIQKLKYKKNF